MQENINVIRKELSALPDADENMKRKRLLRKYNMEKMENLDQVAEKLK
jgi:hypothetical protein